VKPARFLYAAPETIDEVLDLLNAHGDEAKLLAGGQSLMPLMNMRLARPAVMIDINRVRELDYVKHEDGALRIGAMVRQRAAERHPLVGRHLPSMPQALYWVGHTQIRARGTIGGSLVHADPAAELPAVAALHGATFVLRQKSSERVLTAADFFVTYLTTAIAPTELLTEVRIPALPAGTGTSVLEVSRRHGDFAMAGAAAAVQLDGDGRCAGTSRASSPSARSRRRPETRRRKPRDAGPGAGRGTHGVVLRQRSRGDAAVARAEDARRRPAGGSAPHRNAPGLRARRVRRVHDPVR
jgi:carbon-monoxide dehydrogenase medium subunit